METLAEYAIVGTLGAWVLATLAIQLPHVRPWIRNRDLCLLVPEYRFFAPRPAQGDFHLLFRDTYMDDSVSQWTEIGQPGQRHLRHALWHPDKRQRKAIFDSANAVVELERQSANTSRTFLIEVTTPYLNLLNHIADLPRTPVATATQFMVLQSYGWWSNRHPDVLLISKIHKLRAAIRQMPSSDKPS